MHGRESYHDEQGLAPAPDHRLPYEYEGRSHSLWLGDIQQAGQFGWYETSFMLSELSGRRSTRSLWSPELKPPKPFGTAWRSTNRLGRSQS